MWFRELVNKSKALQQEILVEGRGRGSEKEFYKKNSRSVLKFLFLVLSPQSSPVIFPQYFTPYLQYIKGTVAPD